MPTKVDTNSFLAAWYASGKNPVATAVSLGLTERGVHDRLARLEHSMGVLLRDGKGTQAKVAVPRPTTPVPIDLPNGTVLVGSDAHYWPGPATPGHRAFLMAAQGLRPDVVILNGDEFDGSSLSRHAPIGWEKTPDADEELRACKVRMEEVRQASPDSEHFGTFGNHTMRLDTYLAGHAAAVRGIGGMKFEDHLPDWSYNWAYLVNGHTLVKHRLRSGVHATWNNTADAHISTVTGHCHQLQVRPRSTMSPVNNGTIYGVDTGMLADPWGPQFHYMEQGPRNWRSGFALLTFRNGILLPPELGQVISPDELFFRGTVHAV